MKQISNFGTYLVICCLLGSFLSIILDSDPITIALWCISCSCMVFFKMLIEGKNDIDQK